MSGIRRLRARAKLARSGVGAAHWAPCRSSRIGASATSRRPRSRREPTRPAPRTRRSRPEGLVRDPDGRISPRGGRFVVGRHRATRLHYDLRLEIGGVLVSWAVPKGPTLDPDERRMAIHVEDHPLEYFDFEGVIPRGEYGAGDAIVWDWGTFEPEAPTLDPVRAILDGELKFRLAGSEAQRPVHDRPDRFGARSGRPRAWRCRGQPERAGSRGGRRRLAAHPQEGRGGRRRLGRRGSPRLGEDRSDERRGRRPASRRRFEASPPAPEPPIDLSRAVEAADAELDRADARHPDLRRLRRPRLALRDQVGRLSGPGRGPRRARPDAHPERQRRRDLLPEPPLAAGLDRGPARPSSTGRWSPWPPTARPTSDSSRSGSASPTRAAPLVADRPSERAAPGTDAVGPVAPPAPLVYQAFDLLYLDGLSLLAVPLEERKRLLRRVLREHPRVRFASHVDGAGTRLPSRARRPAASRGSSRSTGAAATNPAGGHRPGSR